MIKKTAVVALAGFILANGSVVASAGLTTRIAGDNGTANYERYDSTDQTNGQPDDKHGAGDSGKDDGCCPSGND